jgi:hypothetical protein
VSNLGLVAPPPWCVVVVRAWIDDHDLKVRMLASGDVDGVSVQHTVAAATEQLASWLASLPREGLAGDAAGDVPETPP